MANKRKARKMPKKAMPQPVVHMVLILATFVILVGGAIVYVAYSGMHIAMALGIFLIGAVVIIAGIAAIMAWVMWMTRYKRKG